MTDVLLIAVLVAFFLIAIGLVRVLGRMIDREAGPDYTHDTDGLADQPPDASDRGAAPARTGRPR